MIDHLRREWLLLRADRNLWMLALLFCGLAAFAVVNGASWRRVQQQTLATLRSEEAGRLDSLDGVLQRLARGDTTGVTPFNDPRSPAVAGRSVATRWMLLPPLPLGALAVGQSDLHPYFVRVSTADRQTAVVNEEIENPVVLLAGRLDLAFVILVLFPLFILALTYDVLSAERERGTMALIASQPVNAQRVILTKLAVRAGAVVVLALLVSVGAAAATGASLLTAAQGARLAWWCAIVLAYGLFWFVVALAVNARGASSASNAVTLLGVWFALVIVVPSLVSNGIAAAYPVPPRLALVTAMRDVQNDVAASAPRRADALSEFLAEHPRYQGATKADTSDPQVAAIASANLLEARLRPMFTSFDAQLRARQDAAARLRFLSPVLVAHGALLDAAGTSGRRWRQFEDAWIAFHDAWRTFINDKVFAGTTLTRSDLAAAPVPAFNDEPLRSLSSSLALSALALLVPSLLLALWSVRTLRVTRARAG